MAGEVLVDLEIVGIAEEDAIAAVAVDAVAAAAVADIVATAVLVVGFAVAAGIAGGKIVAVDGDFAIVAAVELEPAFGSYFGKGFVVLCYHYRYLAGRTGPPHHYRLWLAAAVATVLAVIVVVRSVVLASSAVVLELAPVDILEYSSMAVITLSYLFISQKMVLLFPSKTGL